MIFRLIQALRYQRRHRHLYEEENRRLRAQFAPAAEGREINAGVRIGLRLFGILMLVAGLAILGVLIALGPRGMAEAMGQSCASGAGIVQEDRQCTIQDVIGVVGVSPWLILIGAVLVLVLRRPRTG